MQVKICTRAREESVKERGQEGESEVLCEVLRTSGRKRVKMQKSETNRERKNRIAEQGSCFANEQMLTSSSLLVNACFTFCSFVCRKFTSLAIFY